MNGWIKRFADGTMEVGDDHGVANKKASWSRGRLDSMVACSISDGKNTMVLEGPGTYWQSDDLEAIVMLNGFTRLVKRRLQRKITSDDYIMFVQKDKDSRLFRARLCTHHTIPEGTWPYILPIEVANVGKWLTLELDVMSGGVTVKFEDGMI